MTAALNKAALKKAAVNMIRSFSQFILYTNSKKIRVIFLQYQTNDRRKAFITYTISYKDTYNYFTLTTLESFAKLFFSETFDIYVLLSLVLLSCFYLPISLIILSSDASGQISFTRLMIRLRDCSGVSLYAEVTTS